MKLTVSVRDSDRKRKTRGGLKGLDIAILRLIFFLAASCHTQLHLGLLLLYETYSTGGFCWPLLYRASASHSPWLTISGPKIYRYSMGTSVYDFIRLRISCQWFTLTPYTHICCFDLFTQVHPVKRNFWLTAQWRVNMEHTQINGQGLLFLKNWNNLFVCTKYSG